MLLACLIATCSVATAEDVAVALSRAGYRLVASEPPSCEESGLVVTVDIHGIGVRTATYQEIDNERRSRLTFKGKRFRFEATNRGEWGGSLIAIDRDGQKQTLLEDAMRSTNTVALISLGSRLYLFAGLDHMSLNSGSVYVIDDFDTKPRVSLVTLLPEAPILVSLEPGSKRFLMISYSGVMELVLSDFLVVHTIHQFRFEGVASAVALGPNLLLGLCRSIAVVHLPLRDNEPPRAQNASIRYFAK